MTKPQIQIKQSQENGKFYWRLKARNGEIQCPSEGYATKAAAKRGALAAQRNFAVAEIVCL